MSPGVAVQDPSATVLSDALGEVLRGLEPVGSHLRSAGMPVPEWSGKLIRPLVGYAAAVSLEGPDGVPDAVWYALGAVQLAHEASLLHDDVIDGAGERRGEATVVATRGVAAALVEGDHLLTAAYRLAARTGNLDWMDLFARAVERTVAGEKAQARSAGSVLEWAEYEAIVLGKSGELLGAALAAGPAARRTWDLERYCDLGRRVGLVYQMLDDLLDCCPGVETGKPALSDRRRGLWTWPLAYVDADAETDGAEIARRLAAPDVDGVRPLDRCLGRLRAEAAGVLEDAARLMPGDGVLAALLGEWLDAAEAAIPSAGLAIASAGPAIGSPDSAVSLPPVAGWERLMAEHAKSFRFAARLFPADRREQVVGVYAWCRYTDDLVDEEELPASDLEARLDAWLDLSRRAYGGERTGNVLADRVMGEMRAAGVPFGYAAELIEGMRMDVRGTSYGTLAELRVYTYRVASVVGLWLTEMFGIRDPWMLDRAAALGHAMQLTNILRDVGEDLERGRLYLPTTWLTGHGLGRRDLEGMMHGGRIEPEYRNLVERLIRVAEDEYAFAWAAIDRLPAFYRRPVAVASHVYRGIHASIRRNGYDNLTLRAHTSLVHKVRLGIGALGGRRVPAVATPGQLWRVVALAVALLASAVPAPAQEPDLAPDEARLEVGTLWVRAVDDAASVQAGLDAIAGLREAVGGEGTALLLQGYEGSFLALRAKHGGGPRARLRNLRDGFELMDRAVAQDPAAAELRYIRLMSGFYLPVIFGRRGAVQEDLAALARLLPASRASFPPELFPVVVEFVLEHGTHGPAERARLEELKP
jgi:15-cis-phytoene synthase